MESSIHLIGDVTECCKYSHERYGVEFYIFKVSYTRESGTKDEIPVVITYKGEYKIGERVEIFGSIRTCNLWEGDRKRLKVFIFADDVGYTSNAYENDAFIYGNLCKKNPIRETPGGKLIVDAILVVNRAYNKSDYIPCVFWDREAEGMDYIDIGDEIEVSGRLQSRIYEKNCVQYEVIEFSVSQIAQ